MSLFKFKVRVYDENIDLNLKTGKGVDRVIKKMEPTFTKILKKRFMSGYSYLDMKQELAILAIEGIKNYDSQKGVKLSTFLETHINNKLISKIKTHNKMSRNATYLKEADSVNRELSFGSIILDRESEDSNSSLEIVDFESFLNSLSPQVDDKIISVIRLIMFSKMNIKEAAEEVGIRPWVASRALRSLSKNSAVREFYGR
ncbi:sigma-70 family RNA polymerase sigma factor [bacterium]|nr:sigma-70 family RNA polymerase sigma factor [bacterium]